jgi:anti-anti-sigma factor
VKGAIAAGGRGLSQSRGQFEISLLAERNTVVLTIAGRLAPEQTLDAEQTILEDYIRQGHRKVIVDLSKAEHISSTGIGLLLYYSRKLPKRGGRLVVVRPQGHVARVLEMTRLDKALTLCETMEEAFAAAETTTPSDHFVT